AKALDDLDLELLGDRGRAGNVADTKGHREVLVVGQARDDAGVDKGGLAKPRGAVEDHRTRAPDELQELLDLSLPPAEEGSVLGAEGFRPGPRVVDVERRGHLENSFSTPPRTSAMKRRMSSSSRSRRQCRARISGVRAGSSDVVSSMTSGRMNA